ncbi:MAG TPA: glycogen debranching enzyme GlgX, partial [Chloroflexota bacterium]
GNNNAYCQDNEISWYDWELDGRREALLAFTRRLIDLRQRHPNLCRRKFFQGRPIRGSDVKDITWFTPDGTEMTEKDWAAGWQRCFGKRLGEQLGEVDEQGELIVDDVLLILLNGYHEPLPFTLPPARDGEIWELVIDTSRPERREEKRRLDPGARLDLAARSLALLRGGSSG